MPVQPLGPSALCQRCDPAQFKFKTTVELKPLGDFIGQPRAIQALDFGVGIRQKGYNIFAFGPEGIGKENLVRKRFSAAAEQEPVPSDWCYVYNFEQPHQPHALQLPAGKGAELKADMEQFIDDLRNLLPLTFESEEYRSRMQEVQQAVSEQQEQALDELRTEAEQRQLALLRTPAGLAIAPVRDGEVVSPEEFQALPEERREQLENDIQELQEELQKLLLNAPRLQRELRQQIDAVTREMAQMAVGGLMDELKGKYTELPEVLGHLEAVQQDVVKNVRSIVDDQEGQEEGDAKPADGPLAALLAGRGRMALRRYRANLLVDHAGSEGAPVVYEDNPTYRNLLGRVEHTAQMGALVTDFNLIKPGALHRANGGYLILEAVKLFQDPFAWEGLKRALRAEQIRIETPGQLQSIVSTVSLDPEPIPLELKVALLGDPMLYYLLGEVDPESRELFRVASDFDDRMDRDQDSQQLYARLIGSLAQVHGLRPLDPAGVARIIEHSSRLVGDGRKLSIQMRRITDLMREADYWAEQAGSELIGAEQVKQAVDAQIYRSDRLRERVQEEIQRGTILIDTEGGQVGQVNGLSVIGFDDFAFGRPSRITARVRAGKGEVIDIEREVDMGGPIHSKGVLILSSFLGARYSADKPLSLTASLVFEQSYAGVEGDSASSAELYALLSTISDVPIKQSLAVTGSVNQHGRVQAIGGVNKKIEGYFDICRQRQLTGEQGVLIPASNVQHLMLREDVVEAVKQGRFQIYAVEDIDQGIELLTGVAAGEAAEDGSFPDDSINGKVQARLAALAEERSSEEDSDNPGEVGSSEHEEESESDEQP